jgi:hypothetical protein
LQSLDIGAVLIMSNDLNTLVPKALHTLLSETLFRAQPHGGYLLNGGEPGMVDTLKGLSAEVVSKAPGTGRKPIVSHANHVLFGLELINRSVHGDEKAFEGADWNAAWKLTSVDEKPWADLVARLEKTSQEVLDSVPKFQPWNEIMLTGCFACAAHAAYHLGAIRQMLRDLGQVPVTTKI